MSRNQITDVAPSGSPIMPGSWRSQQADAVGASSVSILQRSLPALGSPARAAAPEFATIAGVPKKPVTSTDELIRMLIRVEAAAARILEQQMLHRLRQQTYVGGKRVDIQKLPRLPKSATTTVHRVKASLHRAKPPVWRRLEIPSAMTLDLVHLCRQPPRPLPAHLAAAGPAQAQRTSQDRHGRVSDTRPGENQLR